MNKNNAKIMLEMSINKNVITEIYSIYKILNEDKNFNIIKYIKMMSNIMKGEKIIPYEDYYILSTFLPPFLSEAFKTNIMAVPSKENIFSQQVYAKRSAPISMYLCLTHRCPNNCLYCSAKKRQTSNELTTLEWIKVINDLQNMNTCIIGLTGGEPMLRTDIYEIVNSIDNRSVSTLFTSGYNFTYDKAKELKKCGLFSLGISLDSFDKEKHNQNRNSDTAFDNSIKAIHNSRKAGLYTMAQTVVLKDNVNEDYLFKFFRFAKKQGVHEVKILEPILSGNLLSNDNLSNILYDKDTRKELIRIQHKANTISDLPKITTFSYTESKQKFGCGAGTQHSYISAEGDLYPCDFVPMNFGNVRDESINILWSKMNKIIGKPKIGCFANRINKQVYINSDAKLPLDTKTSIEICKKHKSNMYPDYYKKLQ